MTHILVVRLVRGTLDSHFPQLGDESGLPISMINTQT